MVSWPVVIVAALLHSSVWVGHEAYLGGKEAVKGTVAVSEKAAKGAWHVLTFGKK